MSNLNLNDIAMTSQKSKSKIYNPVVEPAKVIDEVHVQTVNENLYSNVKAFGIKVYVEAANRVKFICDEKDKIDRNSPNLLFIIKVTLLFLVFPIITFSVSASNFYDCQIDDRIPIWLFLNSVILLAYGMFLLIEKYLKVDKIAEMNFLIFFWGLLGSYCVYSAFSKVSYDQAQKSQYCAKSCYRVAFLTVTSTIFIFASYLIIACYKLRQWINSTLEQSQIDPVYTA